MLKPSNTPAPTPPDPLLIRRLRETIRRIERGGRPVARTVAPLAPALDAVLPWGGLPAACLHEVTSEAGEWSQRGAATGPATGFGVVMAARLAGARGVTLWCYRDHPPYAPGLAAHGLDPGRLVLAAAGDDTGILWAMEEALRDGAAAVVVGEVRTLPPTAARRLQLATETGGATGLLLRPPGKRTVTGTTAATTRWHLTAMASGAGDTGSMGVAGPAPAWRVDLVRCRGRLASGPRSWQMEWDYETGDFRLVADLGDGSDRTATAPRGDRGRGGILPRAVGDRRTGT